MGRSVWVAVAVITVIVASFVIHNAGQPSPAYKAGAAWAKSQLDAGYAASNPDDPDPCDNSRAIAFASSGYKFSDWYAGCQSVQGP